MQSFTDMIKSVLGADIVGIVGRVEKVETDIAELASTFGATDVAALITKVEGYETTIADLAAKFEALAGMVVVADAPQPTTAPTPVPTVADQSLPGIPSASGVAATTTFQPTA